ncbi:MAG: ATP-binding protein [Lysobacteraceae bacterium]
MIAQRASRFLASSLNRMVLAYGVALLLAFVAIGGLGLLAYDHLVDRDVRRTVRAEHEDLREVHRDAGLTALARAMDARVDEDTQREAVYLLADAQGRVLAGHLADLPAGATRAHGWLRFPWNEDGDEVIAYVETLPDGATLLTGHSTGEQQRLREVVLPLGLSILLLLALLTLLLGWLLRRSLAHSLQAALDSVDRFAAGRLDERIAVGPGDDPLQRLARTLDRMLDRIRELVGGIQASTDHIAHDLRTPLTRLKTRLELARERSGADAAADRTAVDAALEEAIGEIDRSIATFNSLLRLARIEAGDGRDDAVVALDAIVRDAVEMWQPMAEARGGDIVAAIAQATIAGDRDLLFQLLSNLLDNAVKYGPDGGRIDLQLDVDGDVVRLALRDRGPGIPEADRERVFDRLVRLESHRGSPGNGLGLSVVRAIATRHRAEVRLDDAAPGLRVSVRFPRAATTTVDHMDDG